MHVTRERAGARFTPGAAHHGVRPARLHGREAGATDHFVVTRSEFAAGASVDAGPVAGETVHVLLAGELAIEAAGQRATLSPGDSVCLADRTGRSLQAGSAPASVLVVRSR